MKTIALALLLALFALTPSAHAQSNWYVGEQGANCVTTCAGKGACNVDEMNAIKTVTSVEDAVSNSDWHQACSSTSQPQNSDAAPYVKYIYSETQTQCNFKEPTNFQAATCAATSYWALRLCYCGEPEAAVARPDAKLVLKNDFAGVMFGEDSDVSVRRLVEGDLHLKPAEGRSVMIEASMHIAGGLKLEIDAVSGEDCTSDERGLIRYVTVGSSDQLEVCAQKDDGSSLTIAWRSLPHQV